MISTTDPAAIQAQPEGEGKGGLAWTKVEEKATGGGLTPGSTRYLMKAYFRWECVNGSAFFVRCFVHSVRSGCDPGYDHDGPASEPSS
jgi:hypothetical protein